MAQINPDRGSKKAKVPSGKYPSTINPKVLKLINMLKDFENPWELQ
jgi:hypothetical protein